MSNIWLWNSNDGSHIYFRVFYPPVQDWRFILFQYPFFEERCSIRKINLQKTKTQTFNYHAKRICTSVAWNEAQYINLGKPKGYRCGHVSLSLFGHRAQLGWVWVSGQKIFILWFPMYYAFECLGNLDIRDTGCFPQKPRCQFVAEVFDFTNMV